jgi:hypothetical protein
VRYGNGIFQRPDHYAFTSGITTASFCNNPRDCPAVSYNLLRGFGGVNHQNMPFPAFISFRGISIHNTVEFFFHHLLIVHISPLYIRGPKPAPFRVRVNNGRPIFRFMKPGTPVLSVVEELTRGA